MHTPGLEVLTGQEVTKRGETGEGGKQRSTGDEAAGVIAAVGVLDPPMVGGVAELVIRAKLGKLDDRHRCARPADERVMLRLLDRRLLSTRVAATGSHDNGTATTDGTVVRVEPGGSGSYRRVAVCHDDGAAVEAAGAVPGATSVMVGPGVQG